jgi:hypothetical protein
MCWPTDVEITVVWELPSIFGAESGLGAARPEPNVYIGHELGVRKCGTGRFQRPKLTRKPPTVSEGTAK